MSKSILIPIPQTDFDPTEVSIPWRYLKEAGHRPCFATPSGNPGTADMALVTGQGFGLLKKFLMADPAAICAYQNLLLSVEFNTPLSYEAIAPKDYHGILLPGGHAKGMRIFLESKNLQSVIEDFFVRDLPVGAICHGTLLIARSKSNQTGKSVLWGRKTTSLLRRQELLAWNLTRSWMGDYYRTYAVPTEEEVKSFLQNPTRDFQSGPLPLFKDSPHHLHHGFIVRDGNYLSARWPGDVHRFSTTFLDMLKT